jgi:cytoskeletal protein CcmA (bactofilin family)
MFNSRKKPENSQSAQSFDTDLTCNIVDGTVIEGKMTTSENIRLDGKIIGEVSCSKKMVMGETGTINGNMKANNLFAKGKIVGDVFVSEIIHLMGDALVKGTIHAKKLMVEEGAKYDGECKIG